MIDQDTAIPIEFEVINTSDTAICSVYFEINLYDSEGNLMDTITERTFELKPDISRIINIKYSSSKKDRVNSYEVSVTKVVLTLTPIVNDNEMIAILSHGIFRTGGFSRALECGVNLAIRNRSDAIIASAIFEIIFYDIEGNELHSVKHKEVELPQNTSRRIIINCPGIYSDIIRNYSVKITRTTSADTEKVILRRHEIETTDCGEEVRGIIKNISSVKTDAAIIATFYNLKNDIIGTNETIIADIEPNSLKQFHFNFKPREGDSVGKYSLNIICDVEK